MIFLLNLLKLSFLIVERFVKLIQLLLLCLKFFSKLLHLPTIVVVYFIIVFDLRFLPIFVNYRFILRNDPRPAFFQLFTLFLQFLKFWGVFMVLMLQVIVFCSQRGQLWTDTIVGLLQILNLLGQWSNLGLQGLVELLDLSKGLRCLAGRYGFGLGR